jgi:hypothetical protein
MKFIVKVLADQIKQSYDLWNDERNCADMYGYNARTEYNTILRAVLITNYGMLTAMYENNVISFRDMRLLDRYNDRIKKLYRIDVY